MSDRKLEPWQWPEAHWRAVVDRVRAGRALRPAAWPGGAPFAVALSFDSDHDTNELRDGGESIGRMSQGQYGNRQGVPRILDLLARHAVPASFFVPAVTALLYPDAGGSYTTTEGGSGSIAITGLADDALAACFAFTAAQVEGNSVDVTDGALRATLFTP